MQSGGFAYTLDNKRYHTWNYHMRETFGNKVMKIPLDAGFGCPNRDGTKGWGGCVYCSSSGSGDFAGNAAQGTAEQFERVRQSIGGKWPGASYIAYFQAFTGTYAQVDQLRERFEPALDIPEVVGVAVATRADCLPDPVADYLEDLSKRTWLLVELGLQTIHDKTAHCINRCHSYSEFLEGYHKLRRRGVRTCVHLINGLPGETRGMMLDTVKQVGGLEPHSVKIHMLHILRGTKAQQMYEQGQLPLLTRDEYVGLVCDQLEWLPAETVIQRLTGDGVGDDLIAPLWTARKTVVLNEIDKEMARRSSWQGRLLAGQP